jgi:hypothetical protein
MGAFLLPAVAAFRRTRRQFDLPYINMRATRGPGPASLMQPNCRQFLERGGFPPVRASRSRAAGAGASGTGAGTARSSNQRRALKAA